MHTFTLVATCHSLYLQRHVVLLYHMLCRMCCAGMLCRVCCLACCAACACCAPASWVMLWLWLLTLLFSGGGCMQLRITVRQKIGLGEVWKIVGNCPELGNMVPEVRQRAAIQAGRQYAIQAFPLAPFLCTFLSVCTAGHLVATDSPFQSKLRHAATRRCGHC